MEMNGHDEPIAAPAPASATVRRLLYGANTGLAIGLAALVIGMLNHLGARHYLRADWNRDARFTLSPKTTQLLGALSNRVEAVLFFRPNHALFGEVEALLREYQQAGRLLHVEHVDPDRELTRAAEVTRKYGLDRANLVVFSSGERTAVVSDADLVEWTAGEAGGMARRAGFQGERAFSSAILRVVQPRRPVVYFLQGHGERDPADRDKYAGFSSAAAALAEDNIEVRPLRLDVTNVIPRDAEAVVIAGPDHRIPPAEIETLRAFLAASGRVLLTLDAQGDGGLAPLLAEWGVGIGPGVVVDAARSLSGLELFVSTYGDHPVTHAMSNVTTVLYLPRPLEIVAAPGEDKPRIAPLLFSPPGSWAESDVSQKLLAFDPENDRRGPLPLAVAVERGPLDRVDIDIRPTRLLVVGDTDFVANGSPFGGGLDLFRNGINWLLERRDLLSIAPKPVHTMHIVLDARQRVRLFWIAVAVMPALVGLAGVLVAWRRRT